MRTMTDVRNLGVQLTLTGQKIVDRLKSGDDAQALVLAEHAQQLAEAIAEELSPVGYDYDDAA